MNPQSVIVIIVIAVLFLLALRGAKKSGCGGNCAGCAYKDSCHNKK